MRILFICGQVRIMYFSTPGLSQSANYQHIRITIPSRSCRFSTHVLESTDSCYHIPFIRNITGSTPLITTGFHSPIPYVGSSVTYTINDVTIYFIQCLTHHDIRFLNCFLFRILFYFQITAIVIFQVIYPPTGPGFSINFFMLITA